MSHLLSRQATARLRSSLLPSPVSTDSSRSSCSRSRTNPPLPAVLLQRGTWRLSQSGASGRLAPPPNSRWAIPALRWPGSERHGVERVSAPGRAAALGSSYLEARTIRRKLRRCRGPTSSRSRGAGSGQAHQRRRAQRRLPGPQRLWLLGFLGLAPMPPRRRPPARGAAGVALGARIARAGARGCRPGARSSRSFSRATRGGASGVGAEAEELRAIPSTQKSLASSPPPTPRTT